MDGRNTEQTCRDEKRKQNFNRKPEERRPLRRPRYRWGNNIEMHLKYVVRV